MKTRSRQQGGGSWQHSQDRFHGQDATHRADYPVGGGGTGRKSTGASIIKVGARGYWPPQGLPVPHYEESDKRVMKGPGESYVKKGEAIFGVMVADFQGFFTHNVTKLGDISVLPDKLERMTAADRTRLFQKAYPCTYAETASPRDIPIPDIVSHDGDLLPEQGPWQNYDPVDAGWGEYNDSATSRDIWIFGDPNERVVSVSLLANGRWQINTPELLAFPKYRHRHEWVDLQFALFYAHCQLLWMRSCGFCAQTRYQTLQKVKKDDQRCWRPSPQILLPFFSLQFLYGRDHKSDPEKAGDFKFDGTDDPEGDEVAIRQGWAWLRIRKRSRLEEAKSFQEFGRHVANVEKMCRGCLDDGKVRTDLTDDSGRVIANPHEITVLSLHCPACDSEVVDTRTVRRAVLYKPVQPKKLKKGEEDRGELDLTTAGLHQLKYMQHECPDCHVVAYPALRLQCSTCDDPTPLKVHEVLSILRKHAKGSHYEFEIAEGDDGRVYWEDFTDLALANPPGECDYANSVEDVVRPGLTAADEGTFHEFIDCSEAEEYPDWTPNEQIRFCGGEVVIDAAVHSEPR